MAQRQPGDLIEIFRGTYQHWAINVGDGFVIHLAPPSEHAQAGASSMISVLYYKAVVKKEKLWDVTGKDDYTINNLLDEEYEPRPVYDILKEAQSYVGQELPYRLFRRNCEHFVTELRYGKAESRQVRKAIVIGAGVTYISIVVAAVAAIFGSDDKKKKQTQ